MPLTRPTSATSTPGASAAEGLADPTYTAPSAGDYIIGGYHDFDGVDEQITFGTISALEFNTSSTFTISAWVFKDVNVSGIIGSYDAAGKGWAIEYGTSDLMLWSRNGAFFNILRVASPTINAWHHVLIVYTAGSSAVYLNGNSVSVTTSGTLFYNVSYTNVTNFRAAAVYTGATFPGRIAELAVWSTDQSANVAAIYNSRARHNLMDLATPPDVFYAPLTSYGDDPGSGGSVAEVVANNNGTGVNMETADAIIPTPTTVTSTLTKALDIATSVVTTTKVENVPSGGGTGSSFP